MLGGHLMADLLTPSGYMPRVADRKMGEPRKLMVITAGGPRL